MKEHETDMPYCWCNPRKEVMPNGNMVIIHNRTVFMYTVVIKAIWLALLAGDFKSAWKLCRFNRSIDFLKTIDETLNKQSRLKKK